MDHDYEEQPGWVRLPGYEQDVSYPPGAAQRGAARSRASAVRRTRLAANWTAAALIAGVAAATGYFAHHQPPATSATTSVSGVPGSTASGVPGSTAAGVQKPTLNAPVATSGGSGVTVTTGPNGVKTYHYRGDN
jgi:hypothetical protein